jgi:hypothetical protein
MSSLSLVALPIMWLSITQAGQAYYNETAGGDAYGYWMAWRGGLYNIPWHDPHAFVYPPPIGLVLWPAGLLPWPVFFALLTAVQMVAVVYLVGLPWAALTLIVWYPASHDLVIGNIHVLLAAAIASGHWWFVLLTKATPGIALAYHVAAREWRRALQAVGVTAAIALVTALFSTDLWTDWLQLAFDGLSGTAHPWALLDWPLTVRLPIALGVALAGGYLRWPWSIAVSAMFALPVFWVSAPALLLAVPRLARAARRDQQMGSPARAVHQSMRGCVS